MIRLCVHWIVVQTAASLLIGSGPPALTDAGQTWRISLSSDGLQSNASSGSTSITADGRYVEFTSYASDLVPDDTNGCPDIFVHDRTTGRMERISVSSWGEQGNGISYFGRISGDGRFVAFRSEASNLVPGDTNGCEDVFVRDRLTGETERVNLSSTGEEANGGTLDVAISADGRYVAFDSWASNLVAEDTNGQGDIFVHDRWTGETERVSVSTLGEQGNAVSWRVEISADGSCVGFESRATNLVFGDTNGEADVFVHDRLTGETECVNVSSTGQQGNDYAVHFSLSEYGRCVGFSSQASNLVLGDTNAYMDVFVHDRATGATERISISSEGEQGERGSWGPCLCADGRYVVFSSSAANLVPDDTNGVEDSFLHDRATGETVRVSISSSGEEGNNNSYWPYISADGHYIVFDTQATNLDARADTNYVDDVLVHQRLPGDLVVESPQGWLNPGWNYFSIPLYPAGSLNASTVLGIDCDNILYRWEPITKNCEVYPDDFTYLVRGRGYLLRLDREVGPCYEGLAASGAAGIDLPEAGWTWIGQPFDHDTPLADLVVRNNATEETRTAWEDHTSGNAWVNWNLLWWDSAEDQWKILGLVGGDDNTLHPWYGYLVWSKVRDLALIVPES
jgi:Tol biopolymer transport system component